MIKSFFRSLSEFGVEQLLISGQATVLYGAATFSEDIDLWLNPTPENCERFLEALKTCDARFYKLTPPLTTAHLVRGHGFHFLLPGGTEPEVFLDIMGAPPRVGTYSASVAAARWMTTEWGLLHTLGLKDLVELKKTQRLEDYPIISKLALAWFEQPECGKTTDDFRWAIDNIFTLTSLRSFFDEQPGALRRLHRDQPPELRAFGKCIVAGRDAPEDVESRLVEWMQRRMTALQEADRRFWREIIADLKRMRAAGELMPEGSIV